MRYDRTFGALRLQPARYLRAGALFEPGAEPTEPLADLATASGRQLRLVPSLVGYFDV